MHEVVASSASLPLSRARLFGEFRLTDAAGQDITPTGRKSRALLAYLILTPGPAPRDRLAGLLWGDRGPDQARASVRQALYELRSLNGGPERLLDIQRGSAEVIRQRLGCDLDELRALASGADARGFAALVGEEPADLLADLDDVDSGFDEWLIGQRARRREELQAMGLAVAARALDREDAEGASRLAMLLLRAEPFDESSARLAMQARAALGDRAGVRQVFGRYAQAVREELGLEPSADLAALEAQLSKADALRRGPVDPPETTREPGASAARPGSRRFRRTAALTAVAVAIAGLGAAAGWWSLETRGRPEVLRVEPLAAPASDAPAQALRVGLSADLARMVLANDARLVVEDPADPPAARRPADYVLTGEARSGEGLLHASLRLLDGHSGAILWSQSFERPASDPDATRTQIAARAADVSICAEGGPHPPPAGIDAETLRLYLEGCEQKHGDWGVSAHMLGEAVRRRPDFAHAWAMYAAATAVNAPDGPAGTRALQQAQTFAHKALALDPGEGEAYFALAMTTPGIDHWSQRMAALQEGLRQEPDNDTVQSMLGDQLASVGRISEATAFYESAEQRDPFSRFKASDLIRLLGFAGQKDRADALTADAMRRWPGDPILNESRFRIAAFGEDTNEALRLMEDPKSAAWQTPAEAAVWRAVLAAKKSKRPSDRLAAVHKIEASIEPAVPLSVTEALLQLTLVGDIDGAYRAAAHLPDRGILAPWTLFYGGVAPFRADPRFMSFAARQGLVDIWRRTGRWPDFCRTPQRPYDCAQAAAAARF